MYRIYALNYQNIDEYRQKLDYKYLKDHPLETVKKVLKHLMETESYQPNVATIVKSLNLFAFSIPSLDDVKREIREICECLYNGKSWSRKDYNPITGNIIKSLGEISGISKMSEEEFHYKVSQEYNEEAEMHKRSYNGKKQLR